MKKLYIETLGCQMNKSDSGDNKGTIFLMDDTKAARKKIMGAVTDNYNKVCFDEENQPGISNLMSILSKITGESFISIEKRFEGKGYGDFKREVADVVCALLEKIQTRFKEYNNKEVLDNILKEGASKARVVASSTLSRVSKVLGLN